MGEQHFAERNAEILRLWREGKSALTIALELQGLSRNAVIGAVMRARIRGEDVARSPTAAPSGGRDGGRPKSVAVANAPRGLNGKPLGRSFSLRGTMIGPNAVPSGEHAAVVLGEPGVVGREAVLGLRRGECRFPVGDPRALDFRFCSARVECGSYCLPHARLCYQPTRN